MRVLITGGNGLIGSETARQLVEAGHSVVALDVATQPATLDRSLGGRAGEVAYVRGDITELEELRQSVRKHEVDSIIHLASVLTLECEANPALAVKVNCGGTANVFEVAREQGLRRVVWASSIASHAGYPPEVCVLDDTPPRPTNLYGAAKSINEMSAATFSRLHGLDTLCIRFCFVNGPFRRFGVSSRIVMELAVKPALGLPGKVLFADDTVNWLWIEDAGRALRLAVEAESPSRSIYNIKGDQRSFRECAAYVRSLLPDAQLTPVPGIWGFHYNTDASAIERDLGFRIQWTMEAQFDRLVELVRRDPEAAARIAAEVGPA